MVPAYILLSIIIIIIKISSVQLSRGHHVYKTVWTPLALAFGAFPLSCGSLSIVNVVCSHLTPRDYEPRIYRMSLIKGCHKNYALNSEVCA